MKHSLPREGDEPASGSARAKLEVNALLRLEMRQYTEEVFRGRVAIRPEHAHQTVGGQGSRLRKLPETDCSVDVVAQDRAARLFIAGEHDLDCLTKQRLTEPRFLLRAVASAR
jgi:hypothetical protein